MAIVAPAAIVFTVGQSGSATVSIPGVNTSGWTMRADFAFFNGGTIWATKTTTAGTIVNTPGTNSTAVISLADSDTTGLYAGGYSWQLWRTDTGVDYPITDSSTCRLLGSIGTANPTFTNLSELCAHLGVNPATLSNADAQIFLQLLSAAETYIHGYCGNRQFFYGTYTEYLTPNLNGGPVAASEPPIWSIVSVNVDPTGGFGQLTGTFGTDTLLTAGEDYYFFVDNVDGKGYAGKIACLRSNGWGWWWGSGIYGYGWGGGQTPGLLARQPQPTPGAVKVVYVGGYALIPDDLRLAVWEMVADRKNARKRGVGLQSESGMNYSYSLGPYTDEILKNLSIQQILNKYRRGDTNVA